LAGLMTAFVFDTEPAAGAARTLIRWGDQVNRLWVAGEQALGELGLDGSVAWRLLADVAEALWAAGLDLNAVGERVRDADDRRLLFDPRALAGVAVDVGIAAGSTFSPAGGEPGDTYASELRSPVALGSGRDLILRALADTADPAQVRSDEFELVRLADDRFVVVLPGVIDLSHPGWGLSSNRSVRDLDQAAIGSFGDTGLQGDRYAQMVRAGLHAAGVPAGAELVIVGHSFGADAALDLAADAGFNGDDGYRVSHVVAAGYASGEQLPAVPESTEVLVLQNTFDVPAAVEELALHPWLSASAGTAGLSARMAAQLSPSVAQQSPAHVVVRFSGGIGGAGHAQRHYIEYLDDADHPAVVAFLASLTAATVGDGPGGREYGVASAIDVSVPDLRPAAPDDDQES
jgi:hypothetical protein